MRIAIGTRKGLWLAARDGAGWRVSQPVRHMAEFSAVEWLPRPGQAAPRLIAAARSWFWGPSVLTSDDDGLSWSEPEAGAIAFAPEAGAALERVWTLRADPYSPNTVWAGGEPHSLWRSTDAGAHFDLVDSLWQHPHRSEWAPGGGGPAVHTIAPRPDGSMVIAMSAGGVYRSDGSTWVPANQGIRVDFAPEEYPEFGQCVHRVAVAAGDGTRLYAQNHGGVYRSDDSGGSWSSISAGLPANFGFVVLAHPRDRDSAWVIPVDAETMFPPHGRLRPWRTTDAGATWSEVGVGLPDENYASVLRDAAHALDVEGSTVIAFGTRNGAVYASTDEGETFTEVASRLPDVLSVRVSP